MSTDHIVLFCVLVYLIAGFITSSICIVMDRNQEDMKDLDRVLGNFIFYIGLWPLIAIYGLCVGLKWIPMQYVKFLLTVGTKKSNKDITA